MDAESQAKSRGDTVDNREDGGEREDRERPDFKALGSADDVED